MHVTVLFDVLLVCLVPHPMHVSVVSLSVSPDDGSCPEEVPVRWRLDLFIEYRIILLGIVCVSVELAVFFVFVGFFPAGFPN